MSEIPYSIRDKNIKINAIKGLNWDDIPTNHIFKKVDENNAGDKNIISTTSTTQNTLNMTVGSGILKRSVGVLDGESDLVNTSLYINTIGNRNRGITIQDNGTRARVGIGITEPEEDLEIDGNIQIDSENVARLKFQQTGQNPHALSEITSEVDGTNGGTLQFHTKIDNFTLTEKLRINQAGAIGIVGANFGNQGAVLQSNGENTRVTWRNPYYLNLGYNTDTGNDNMGNDTWKYPNFVFNTSRYLTQNTEDYSTTGSNAYFWTPTNVGTYLINARIHVRSQQDKMIEFRTVIVRHDIGGSEEQWAETSFRAASSLTDGSDDIFNYSGTITTIVRVENVSSNAGERYRLRVLARTHDSSNLIIFKNMRLTTMEITQLM